MSGFCSPPIGLPFPLLPPLPFGACCGPNIPKFQSGGGFVSGDDFELGDGFGGAFGAAASCFDSFETCSLSDVDLGGLKYLSPLDVRILSSFKNASNNDNLLRFSLLVRNAKSCLS